MQDQSMYYTPPPLVIPDSQSHASYLVASGFHFPPTSISQNVFATSSLTSANAIYSSCNANFSWAHTVPTYMPWAVQKERGPLVRFTAPTVPDPCTSQTATTWKLLHNLGTTNTRSGHSGNQHLKRRSEEESKSSKQYITEEILAARMNQLCISNEYTMPQQKKTVTFQLDESDESDTDDLPSPKGKIQFSPELKKLMEPNPMILKALMNNNSGLYLMWREKPSMALVLWQPPVSIVPEEIQQVAEASQVLSSLLDSVASADSNLCSTFPEHNNNNPSTRNLNTINGSSGCERNVVEDSTVDMDDMEL